MACGNNNKTSSNETSTIATNNETENNTQENTTQEKQEANSNGLSDEELLALPETDVKQFTYEETEDGIVITNCLLENNGDTVVVIPNQIDGKDVVRLDLETFLRSQYKAVVINNNLNKISAKCFMTSKINQIIMQEGLEIIGSKAFYMSDIVDVKIPNTVKRIDSEAFGSCDIKEVTIPKSVEEIGVAAFSCCYELETVTFEGNCTVESGAFTLSSNIKKVICLDGDITFANDEFYQMSDLDPDAATEERDLTFVAPAGSKVEQYAKDRGFKFEALD